MDWTQWLAEQRQRLSASPVIGYASGEPPAAEPTAVVALAATSQGWLEPGIASGRALLKAQLRDGSVAVMLSEQGPFWSTALAALAWRQFNIAWPQSPDAPLFRAAEERAIEYLLSTHGEKVDYSENVGHDTQLVGWPWVLGTHSWVEPTAFAVLALRHAGLGNHPRTQEACQLLADRWLPDGGANYGNTFVLGQQLRPHVLPSALSALALSRCQPEPERRQSTLRYLHKELQQPLGAVSLGWTVLAMNAPPFHNEQAVEPKIALRQTIERHRKQVVSHHGLNMLLLAIEARRSTLLDMPEIALPAHMEARPG